MAACWVWLSMAFLWINCWQTEKKLFLTVYKIHCLQRKTLIAEIWADFKSTLGSDMSTVTKLSAAHSELCRGSWGSFLPISGGILTCIINASAPQDELWLAFSHCQPGATLSDFTEKNEDFKLPKCLLTSLCSVHCICVSARLSLNSYTFSFLIRNWTFLWFNDFGL